jgi:hypothetical protein
MEQNMVIWKVKCLNGFNMLKGTGLQWKASSVNKGCWNDPENKNEFYMRQQMAVVVHRQKEHYIAVSEPRRCPSRSWFSRELVTTCDINYSLVFPEGHFQSGWNSTSLYHTIKETYQESESSGREGKGLKTGWDATYLTVLMAQKTLSISCWQIWKMTYLESILMLCVLCSEMSFVFIRPTTCTYIYVCMVFGPSDLFWLLTTHFREQHQYLKPSELWYNL